MQRRTFLALVLAAAAATPARADAKFEAFIQTLWPRVQKAGYSRALFDAAFAGIIEPDPLMPASSPIIFLKQISADFGIPILIP